MTVLSFTPIPWVVAVKKPTFLSAGSSAGRAIPEKHRGAPPADTRSGHRRAHSSAKAYPSSTPRDGDLCLEIAPGGAGWDRTETERFIG